MGTRKLTLGVDGQGLHEITREVEAAVAELAGSDGLCTVFIPHTSASLTIQENADPSAQRDLERWLERLGERTKDGNRLLLDLARILMERGAQTVELDALYDGKCPGFQFLVQVLL